MIPALNYDILTPQQKRIVDYLRGGHTLTNMVAQTALGIGSPTKRLSELRLLGWPITTRAATSHDGRVFYKYDLEANEAVK
jgi:hypothetical protein